MNKVKLKESDVLVGLENQKVGKIIYDKELDMHLFNGDYQGVSINADILQNITNLLKRMNKK